ncbi:endonuclease/exonuclease/phosphatase family protein [Novosphingobium malaysiense]|uniref:Endonuclease n=1 Tax=Novosphingobium malaysiense TaxID=1348853 RepID=A0A0B1ZMG6_9SPHN|nr:endonuclease/exonuclease/phosphatase family protein [Novosphingobium malaysiense]KHK92320.1 endonuclease [Novosphingobium malaysiense]
MKLLRPVAAAAAILTLIAYVPRGAPAAVVSHVAADVRADAGKARPALSVMTWNVKGLPMPAAFGRSTALTEIGHRLRALRRSGHQPHIVLLQEAFVAEAKAIGARAGYPYVAVGPRPEDASPMPTATLDRQFRRNARWSRGEGEGKWVGSGLVILSDYPIVDTRRAAFPQDACAGFDCLAAKGVLLARVAVPGAAKPVVVIDTHLNSRHASGVSVGRANAAYAWQADAVRRFVAQQVGPDDIAIFGGDFNIGHDPVRRADAIRNGGFLPGGQEAIAVQSKVDPAGAARDADFVAVADRAKDKEYFRAGKASQLELRDVEVPFGIAEGGFDLSDHLGFVATYRISDSARAN